LETSKVSKGGDMNVVLFIYLDSSQNPLVENSDKIPEENKDFLIPARLGFCSKTIFARTVEATDREKTHWRVLGSLIEPVAKEVARRTA